MSSQTDLDQGGTFRQTGKVYMGPSIGWVPQPNGTVLRITAAGTTAVQLGNSLVMVNVNGSVTLTLPRCKGNDAGAGAVPGTFVEAAITFVDIGGHASASPITITPNGSETIMGLTTIQITSDYGLLTLVPDTTLGNWSVSL